MGQNLNARVTSILGWREYNLATTIYQLNVIAIKHVIKFFQHLLMIESIYLTLAR